MFKRFKVTGINENPKKPKRNLMKYLALGCVMALPAFALLKTGVLSMNKNVLAADKNKYDIVADLDGGKFEMGTTPEFTKMDNGNWLYKYKPVPTPTKLPVPVKDGYDFTGWTVSAKPDIQKEYSIPAWHKGNLNVKANWKLLKSNLLPGPQVNTKLKSLSGYNRVEFIKGVPKDGLDISELQDKSIMAYLEGDILKIVSLSDIYTGSDASSMFMDLRNVTNIEFGNFNSSNATDVSNMFKSCVSLKTIDFAKIDISSATAMKDFICGCKALTKVDVSSLNTGNIVNMRGVFYDCDGLTNIDISSWNTSKVQDIGFIVAECNNLVEFNMEGLDLSSVTIVRHMFKYCEKLETVFLENLDFSKIKNTEQMFGGCTKLSGSITINGGATTAYKEMFYKCSTDPNAKFVVNYTTGFRDKAQSMVNTKSSNSNVVLGNIPAVLTTGRDFNKKIKTLTDWQGPLKIYFTKGMPSNITNYSNIDVSAEQNRSIIAYKNSNIIYVSSNSDIIANPNSSNMFYDYFSLTELRFNNFNTEKVKSMSNMFFNCNRLTNIGSLPFYTNKVTNMNSMFANCSSLERVDMSSFNTKNVTDMGSMFNFCPKLRSIEFGDTFSLKSVDNTVKMFNECSSLSGSLVLDTENINSYTGMFEYCSTDSAAKFTVKFINEATKSLAKRLVATKSENSNVLMDGAEYNITYVLNSGKFTNGTSAPNKYKCTEETIIPNPIKDGSEFLGWVSSDNIDAKPVKDYKISKELTGDIELVAAWGTVLCTGKSFNEYIQSQYMRTSINEIRFIKGDPIGWTDFSESNNGAIKGSIENNILTIASKDVIFANADCYYMFNWTSASKIVLDNFNTSKVTIKGSIENNILTIASKDVIFANADCYYMFNWTSASKIVLDNFNTSKVTNMSSMFTTNSADIIGLEKFDTSNVTNMAGMFSHNSRSVDLSSFNTSKVTDMSSMFSSYSAKDIKGLENLDTSNVTDMSDMFNGCALPIIFNTSKVTDMSSMFSSYSAKDIKGLENLDTSNVTDMSDMFNGCALPIIDVSNFDTSKVTNMYSMFSSGNIVSIKGLENLDTSNVTDMSYMFFISLNLQNINLSNLDTSSVTDMDYMFYKCRALKTIDVSNFNTSNVLYMYNTFAGCSNLESIDISNFDISKVTTTSCMFSGCESLTDIRGLENLNTSNVTNMEAMFSGCSSLTSLDLHNFSTDKVKVMSSMFSDCNLLTNIKGLENFNTTLVKRIEKMFKNCKKLSGEITIMSSAIDNNYGYTDAFLNCSIDPTTKFTVKYVDEVTKVAAEKLVATKSSNSNVFLDNSVKPAVVTGDNSFNEDESKMLSIKNMTRIAEKLVATKSSNSNVFLDNSVKPAVVTGDNSFNEDESKMLSIKNMTRIFDNTASNIIGRINTSTSYAAAHQNPKTAAITRQINITLNNGSMAMYPVQKIQVNSGKIGDLAKPDLNPKYAGQFGGYFYDKRCTIPVKPNDVVTQDIELYAKW